MCGGIVFGLRQQISGSLNAGCIGLQLLGKPEGDSIFNRPRFQTRPLYSGNPWFLASAVRYYQLLDRLM